MLPRFYTAHRLHIQSATLMYPFPLSDMEDGVDLTLKENYFPSEGDNTSTTSTATAELPNNESKKMEEEKGQEP